MQCCCRGETPDPSFWEEVREIGGRGIGKMKSREFIDEVKLSKSERCIEWSGSNLLSQLRGELKQLLLSRIRLLNGVFWSKRFEICRFFLLEIVSPSRSLSSADEGNEA